MGIVTKAPLGRAAQDLDTVDRVRDEVAEDLVGMFPP
jgi:hypothetical protein